MKKKSVKLTPIVIGEPEKMPDGSVQVPAEVSDELKQAVAEMGVSIREKVAELEGRKTAVVVYLLRLMGKNINRRQLSRIKRVLLNDGLTDTTIRKEVFLYDSGGQARKIAGFNTLIPVNGKFELRFETSIQLTEEQKQDIEKLLNYEHVAEVRSVEESKTDNLQPGRVKKLQTKKGSL